MDIQRPAVAAASYAAIAAALNDVRDQVAVANHALPEHPRAAANEVNQALSLARAVHEAFIIARQMERAERRLNGVPEAPR